MKGFLRTVIVLSLVLPAGRIGLAQQGVSGELIGTVSANSSALPGVAVSAVSASLQGSRAVITGGNGGFRMGSLPPGLYQLSFVLQGMESVQLEVVVALAQVTRTDVEMRPAILTAAIDVNDHLVATATTEIISNFLQRTVDHLPAGRNVRDIILLAPGVTPNGPRGQITISGAPSWDNMFLLNGVVINENLAGQPHELFIEDAIEETAVLGGGISAEYGRFTGGVVTALTKSGGNEFAGSLRDSLTNSEWTLRTPWPGQPAFQSDANHLVEATLGGFLMRDRVWFFAAARISDLSQDLFTAFTNIHYVSAIEERRWEGKVSTQFGSHDLQLSLTDISKAETNVPPNLSGRVLELSALAEERTSPSGLLTFTYHGIAATDTMVEGQYSRKEFALQGNGGLSTDRIAGTWITDRSRRAGMNSPGFCGICGPDKRNNSHWSLKGSHYRNSRWGNHTLVAGAENFLEERVDNGRRSGSGYGIQAGSSLLVGSRAYPRIDGSTGIGWTEVFKQSSGTDLQTRGIYVNDRWDLTDRLNFNLGVRYDQNHSRDADGKIVSDDAAVSPRLGVSYELPRMAGTKLTVTYGRYVSKILEGQATAGSAQEAGTYTTLFWVYRGPFMNQPGTPVDQLLPAPEVLRRLFAWFDSVGGLSNREFLSFTQYAGYSSRFDDNLKSPAVDEATLGASHTFGGGFLRVDLISRDWRDFYAARLDTSTGQRIDPLGNRNDVAVVLNEDEETQRTYRAVHLQGSWRAGRWSAGGSYAWSKLRGNDDAEEETIGYPPKNLPLRLWYPEYLDFIERRPVGYLKQDQRHRGRVWLGYDVPFRRGALNISVLQSYQSGRPYSAQGEIDATGRSTPFQDVPANPGYSLSQILEFQPYFFGERGAYRTEAASNTDVAVNLEQKLLGTTLFLQGEVFNALNQSAVISVDTTVVTRQRNGPSSGLAAFNPRTERPVEGTHYRLGPSFGKPTGPSSYQTPRTFQLSVGLRF